jgi:hypothetical protein
MNKFETNEARMFSSSSASASWLKALRATSRSAGDMTSRKNEYQKVFANLMGVKEQMRLYSGYTEIPLLSNQYFNATMASYVRSFAGFMSIERAMDQPTALLYYYDILGVTDNRVVLPNVGQGDLNNIGGRVSVTAALVTNVTLNTGKKLIPGQTNITLTIAADPGNPIKLKDDANGNITAPAGMLTAGTINYTTGAIAFDLGSIAPAAGDTYSIVAIEDVAGAPVWNEFGHGQNRVKLSQGNITVVSTPDILIGESNLMTMAAMSKAMGVNAQDVMATKLAELYTNLINQRMIQCLVEGNDGNVFDIDFTTITTPFHDFRSNLDWFAGQLIELDTVLAHKSAKGVKATAYIVGTNVGNQFAKMTATGKFVPNTESTFINDLLGTYDGVPVLRHTDIGINDGYAIHKTPGGELAPVMRGIFLPLTNTPLVGSYQNPTQMAQGIFYQEANSPIVSELAQKFTLHY